MRWQNTIINMTDTATARMTHNATIRVMTTGRTKTTRGTTTRGTTIASMTTPSTTTRGTTIASMITPSTTTRVMTTVTMTMLTICGKPAAAIW